MSEALVSEGSRRFSVHLCNACLLCHDLSWRLDARSTGYSRAWELLDPLPSQLGVTDLYRLERGILPSHVPTERELRAAEQACRDAVPDLLHSDFLAVSERIAAIQIVERIRQYILLHMEALPLFLGLSENRIVFYQGSVLGDYVQRNDSGILVSQRALVTYHNRQFGSFNAEQIAEFEDMLNNPRTRELDYQAFLERNPHFFNRWQHSEVHSQVLLARENDSSLVPDVILTDANLHSATVVELKLPRPRLVRRQTNRDRFSSAVQEARGQLLEYRDYFRDRQNRQRAAERLNMEVYEPRLAVIIGRSSDFTDAFDRQHLQATIPEVEVVTYDDLLLYAKRRRVSVLDGKTIAIETDGRSNLTSSGQPLSVQASANQALQRTAKRRR